MTKIDDRFGNDDADTLGQTGCLNFRRDFFNALLGAAESVASTWRMQTTPCICSCLQCRDECFIPRADALYVANL